MNDHVRVFLCMLIIFTASVLLILNNGAGGVARKTSRYDLVGVFGLVFFFAFLVWNATK